MVYDITPQDALRMSGLKPMSGGDLPPTQLASDEAPQPSDERPFLGLHNIARDLCAIGCYDCEAALDDVRLVDMECPGQPPGELTYIDEQGRRTDHREAAEPGVVGYSLMGVGRNDPCPCGSGKKYKYCHGA